MPRGPRRLAISFGVSSLTHYGGVYVLHRFLTRIGFKNALASDIRLVQRNNRYSIGEMLLALLYPILLGLDRIETTQLLRQNGVLQYLTGLPSYPDATSLRRFLPGCTRCTPLSDSESKMSIFHAGFRLISLEPRIASRTYLC